MSYIVLCYFLYILPYVKSNLPRFSTDRLRQPQQAFQTSQYQLISTKKIQNLCSVRQERLRLCSAIKEIFLLHTVTILFYPFFFFCSKTDCDCMVGPVLGEWHYLHFDPFLFTTFNYFLQVVHRQLILVALKNLLWFASYPT